MSDEIVFFTHPYSRGRIAHFMLEELGVPYRTELLDFDKREHKTPKFKAVNPMGKVPTLIHRDTIVTEAGAICAYLADAFPKKGLAPAFDDPARATYLRWMFFGAACVEPALVDHLLRRPPPEPPSAVGYGSYGDTLDALEIALGKGPFILGERFTAVDVYLGSQVAWGIEGRSLEPRPRFQLYLERVSARPAYKRMLTQCAALGEKLAQDKEAKAKKQRARAGAAKHV